MIANGGDDREVGGDGHGDQKTRYAAEDRRRGEDEAGQCFEDELADVDDDDETEDLPAIAARQLGAAPQAREDPRALDP